MRLINRIPSKPRAVALAPLPFVLGELFKVVLIGIAITPFMTRDVSQRVLDIPTEQRIKAQTIGASSLVIALRVTLPQVLPRLLSNLRVSLGSAWLFVIAAEAVASDVGLGYRFFWSAAPSPWISS